MMMSLGVWMIALLCLAGNGIMLVLSMEFELLIERAMDEVNKENFQGSIGLLKSALDINTNDFFANQLLGSVYAKVEAYQDSVLYLKRSLDLVDWKEPRIGANYIEVLRASGNLQEAKLAGERLLVIHPNSTAILYFNLGVVEEHLANYPRAVDLYYIATRIDKMYLQAWHNLIEIFMNDVKLFEEAEKVSLEAIQYFPDNHWFYLTLGLSQQHLNKLDEAIESFYKVLSIDPKNYNAKTSIGAAFQVLGKAELAIEAYESAMPFHPTDSAVRNNFGALLGVMNRKDEEVYWLKEALALDPYMAHALVNLGGYYQDEGLLPQAEELFRRAISVGYQEVTLAIRLDLMMYPVCDSWKQMIESRNEVIARLQAYVSAKEGTNATKNLLDASLDRVHFYIVYHGVNDRRFQELVARVYRISLLGIGVYVNNSAVNRPGLDSFIDDLQPLQAKPLPWLAIPMSPAFVARFPDRFMSMLSPQRLVRVGFMSKFFGIFEPHGLLLDGIMRYLPRHQFEVIALPVARTDHKPCMPSIFEAADRVIELSLQHEHAIRILEDLNLDILVFADTMSEPITHFLAHSRLAKVQMAFWGNPVTSASDSMDYFVSADFMEHPFRTRMPISHEPYTEQVVLLEGQGIWYYQPEPSELTLAKAKMTLSLDPKASYSREEFGLSSSAFVFLCPQSVFKMHPLFDSIFAAILMRVPRAHIVVTGGRRRRWTNIYRHRLVNALGGPNSALLSRFHIIPRVSSEKFLALFSIANAVLHPFPFDGSRTSADALIAGIPYVTLPTEYLRGRMGASFLRTLNLPELVARDRDDYVAIAQRLCDDADFYATVTNKITHDLPLIWEDLEVPYEWYRLFSTTVSLPSLTWEDFLLAAGRNVSLEQSYQARRLQNRAAFDLVWGREWWLLDAGRALLETNLSAAEIPAIFNKWQSMVDKRHSLQVKLPAITPFVDSDESPSGPSQTYGNQSPIVALNSDLAQTTRVDAVKQDENTGTKWWESRSQSQGLDIPDTPRQDQVNEELFEEIRQLALTGRFEAAFQLAVPLSKRYQTEPLFLFEFGAIQFHRSEYKAAFEYCSAAAKLVPTAIVAYACAGVSAMYLNMSQTSIDLLLMAWKLDMSGVLSPIRSKMFRAERTSLEFNLLSALFTFKRLKECVDVATIISNLPSWDSGGLHIVLFSLVDWSPARSIDMQLFEKNLRTADRLALPSTRTLLGEIKRMQLDFGHILNPFTECICDYVPADIRNAVISDLMSIVKLSGAEIMEKQRLRMSALSDEAETNSVLREVYSRAGIVLVMQHFLSDSPAVMADMSSALQLNLDNPGISEIYLLNEKRFDYSTFRRSWKIKQYVVESRIKFSEVFYFANSVLQNRTVAVVNADIYFDDSIFRLGDVRTLDLRRNVLALAKWLMKSDDDISLQLRTNSQDAWIFQPPLHPDVISLTDFYMGIPRCDNRVAEVLASSGHPVLDPAFAIHAIELHSTKRPGSVYNLKGSAPGPVRDVLLSDRHLF